MSRRGERGRASVAGGDAGAVAAELALALPAVMLTLLLGATALGAASRQVVLQDATADAARLLGRGEEQAAARGLVAASVDGARMTTEHRGDLVCVTAGADVRVASFLSLPVTARSCALGGGR
ncbi:MAG: TadE family type IV pilus minor pilin [Actinomycetota bacterium]